MKELIIFLLFSAIQGKLIQRSLTNAYCLTDSNERNFGDLKYIQRSSNKCIHHLTAEDSLSTCVGEMTSDLTEEKVTCSAELAASCPTTVSGCELQVPESSGDDRRVDDDDDLDCIYICKHQELECPSEDSLNYPFLLPEDHENIFCFDKSYETCEKKNEDSRQNQIKYTCESLTCGFINEVQVQLLETPTKVITTTFDAGAGNEAGNKFNCDAATGKTNSGCDCVFALDSQTTSMTCEESSYEYKCNVNSCVQDTCYEGEPIIDYVADVCTNVFGEYEYCSRNNTALLPCGNHAHLCGKTEGGLKNQCQCTDVISSTECAKIDKSSWTVDNKCMVTDIALEETTRSCDKVCFNETLSVMNCTESNTFIGKFWQCFDDFETVTITNDENSSFFKAEKIKASYDNFEKCYSKSCPNGDCICEDEEIDVAVVECAENYVYEKQSTKTRDEIPDEETTAPYEFQCLSFSQEKRTINYINPDLSKDAVSECLQLEEPEEGSKTATCPIDYNSCEYESLKDGEATIFGHVTCSCDSECTYECADSKYDPVFSFTEDETDIFKSYTCEKDNLVMIICTSIFVPLGVAGIAAGVYFFFFHESSEVAPVETDTELGNKSDEQAKSANDDESRADTRSENNDENI